MTTRRITRALLSALGALLIVAPLQAQTRRLPPTPYGTSDFSKLRWLAGSWAGTAEGENAVYERFNFTSDSTAEITYYRDPGFTQELGTGRLYMSVGRVYHTFGANRWAASKVGAEGLYFVPQTTARNTFAWTYESPDAWTATMRTGVGGHERVTVYHMKRAQP